MHDMNLSSSFLPFDLRLIAAGGMHAVKRHRALINIMAHNLGILLGTLLRILSLVGLDRFILKPIPPTSEGLVQSVIDDVNTLKRHPLIPDDIGIYGFVYSTEDGSLKEVAKRVPDPQKVCMHLS